jgi:hypothetical protein
VQSDEERLTSMIAEKDLVLGGMNFVLCYVFFFQGGGERTRFIDCSYELILLQV